MTAFLWVFATGFIGAHVGWYWLQQTHVPEKQRHDHPVIKWYKTYIRPKGEND